MSNPRGAPENLKPWKPGQSGNPGGKKKGQSITAELNKLADEVVTSKDGAKMTRIQALGLIYWQEALNPKSRNFQFCSEAIYNRREGKALERVRQEIEGSIKRVRPRAYVSPAKEQ